MPDNMSEGSKPRGDHGDSESKGVASKLKYKKPKIMLFDVSDLSAQVLMEAGFNVIRGSFGHPYKVPVEDGLKPIYDGSISLCGITEQEIVVVDLGNHNTADGPSGEKETSLGASDWWVSCSRGIIDPRPRYMMSARSYTDRILDQGEGIFVIFADYIPVQHVSIGRDSPWGFLSDNSHEAVWTDLLSILGNLTLEFDSGQECKIAGSSNFGS